MTGNYSSIIILVLLFAVLYFLMLRPQQKQQKKRQETLNQLSVGDHVVTIGRLHGIISEIDSANKVVTLDCEGIYLTFDIAGIATVSEKAPAATTAVAAESSAAAAESAAESDASSAESVASSAESELASEENKADSQN
ncbi:preprotein translocase subunit YajC [Levilactobacillus bambusae]|uniref:preprotein translocase subunit YajC n=1 Tax=Levilactobacillus bambusae TaxID=2024736 RepID=UPI001CDB2751|nr:preprotein translocase subunit YajC [Levilactobacillus bambusae]